MKIPILRAKNKFKRHKGNLHFGKILLTLLLVSMMVLGNVEFVKADEPLYYYDKYSVAKNVETGVLKEDVRIWLDDVFCERGGDSCWLIESYYPFYRDVVSNNGEIVGEDRINKAYNYLDWVELKSMEGKYVKVNQEMYKIINFIRTHRTNHGSSWVAFDLRMVTGISYSRGSFIRTTTGTYNQYPTNGIHSDGYWYVRKGLVNNNPTLSISTPTENSYFV